MALRPIAKSVRARRKKELGIACRKTEAGCCKSTVKLHAETMKRPRHAASIKYSGQWLFRNDSALGEATVVVNGVSASATGSRFSPSLTVLCIAHRIRRYVISDKFSR